MRKGHEHVAIDPTPEENDLQLLPGESDYTSIVANLGTSLTIEWLQGARGGSLTVTEGTTTDAIAALDYIRSQIATSDE
jgi:hypothetical protein